MAHNPGGLAPQYLNPWERPNYTPPAEQAPAPPSLDKEEEAILAWINTKVTPKVLTKDNFLQHKENDDFSYLISLVKSIAIVAADVSTTLNNEAHKDTLADPILAIVNAAKGGARRNRRRSTRKQNRRSRNNRRSRQSRRNRNNRRSSRRN